MENTLFQEPQSTAALDSNCTACGGSVKRRCSTPSLLEPNSKKISLRPSSGKSLVGFTKIALPITAPLTWASPCGSNKSSPPLRRCLSDPVSSPGGDTSGVLMVNTPLSPEDGRIVALTPSPPKAGSSASVALPVAVLRRSFSDPSPKACPDSVNGQSPKSKRMKRMKDGMREMRQWLDEVMCEGEDQEEEEEEEYGGYELDDKNGAPKDHEPETESEEAVSVETSGEVLIIRIKCPCGKGFKILLHGNNCYYKLL